MSGKLKLLVGIGVGYVLGTRAGRERYEQLKAKAQTVWQDPRTQEKVHQARDVAAEKAGEAAQSLKETAQEKIRHSGSAG